MSYRVVIGYRGKTLTDIFNGVQEMMFAGEGVWPCVKLIYENSATFLSAADIMVIDVSEEEEDER